MFLLALVGLGAGGYVWFRNADKHGTADAHTTVERKTPSVVTAIQSLARLESVSFHIERVVDIKITEQRLWGLVEAEDTLLLVAVGDVIAGVDLGKLKPADITLDEASRQARLVLPPPEVFSARLDSQRTYVHKRDTDLLATGGQGLETEARRRAEVTIHDAALAAGILEHARRNAGHTVRALATAFGYDTVIIEWRRE
jgi:hypothetical protein